MTSKTRGGMTYVPPVIIDELEDIMREDKIPRKADAFKKMVEYGRVGRDVNRLSKVVYVEKIKTKDSSFSFGDLFK